MNKQFRIFKGCRDFLPNTIKKRRKILEHFRKHAESFGFQPMETPAIEYLDLLTNKYGDEAEHLIYRLSYKNGNTAGLRYDLTVPLSRFIENHRETLTFPFKRYQTQNVWRAEKPQIKQGRFREFTQCDVDIIGDNSVIPPADVVTVLCKTLEQSSIRQFHFKFNHVRILHALAKSFGFLKKEYSTLFRGLDKLDKTSCENILQELQAIGLPKTKVQDFLNFTTQLNQADFQTGLECVIQQCKTFPEALKEALKGKQELESILQELKWRDVASNKCVFSPILARGLDYYTDIVFECMSSTTKDIGSLAGGGQYNALIPKNKNTFFPATGGTLGLDRIITLLERKSSNNNYSSSQVLLIRLGQNDSSVACLATQLRKANISCEYLHASSKLEKQFKYANGNNIPIVIFCGSKEQDSETWSVKNLQSGKQESCKKDALIPLLKNLLRNHD